MDRLEKTLNEQDVSVVRLNAMDGLGRSLSSRYGVRGVPTLIVLTGDGEQVLRQVGRIQAEGVIAAVASSID